MMTQHDHMKQDVSNPLDSVEDILAGQRWSFNRANPDELTAEVTGKHGTYRMIFMWQEEFSALQFSCQYDLYVPRDRFDLLALALAQVNAELWLGHFDIPAATGIPTFRHTSLFRGQTHSSGAEFLQDLMDIALAECESHYSMFQVLAQSEDVNQYEFDLAVMGSAGEA